KSAIIIQSVLDRKIQDERSENAVRTAAVRLRAALNAYNSRQKTPLLCQITLPKGRYVPEFIFSEDLHPEQKVINVRPRLDRRFAIALIALVSMLLFGGSYVYFAIPQPPQHIQLIVRPTE